MTTIHGVAKEEWADFLRAFSRRNHDRRARFEFFEKSGVRGEEQEGHLESVTVESDGADAPRVRVKRRDESGPEPRPMSRTISSVRRISVQLDTDGSEDALEIEDTHGALVMLRMESKVDGAS
jgi:hypothetical protein